MKLGKLEEGELVKAIRQEFFKVRKEVIVNIGDDSAVVRRAKKPLIITKDLLVENVDFILSLNPPYYLGRKSLNVNLSDVAAMGGVPKFALLGLALPSKMSPGWAQDFFCGFKSAAEQFGVTLIGGDLSRAKIVFISVTVVGEGDHLVQRSGAEPGDIIFVSGTLGNSRHGLSLLKKGFCLGQDKAADVLLRAFLDPVPQIELGRALSKRQIASSMIDISDGLSVDIGHLCEESGVGAEIELEKIPLSSELISFEPRAIKSALHGGEDFSLLFTVPCEKLPRLERIKKKFQITAIGRMTEERGVYTIDRQGKKKPLPPKGYRHF